MDSQDQAVLERIGRPGWSITGRAPAPDSQPTVDRLGQPVPAKYPEGSQQWTISDGKGHNQTLVVYPPPKVGDTVAWPTDANGDPIPPASGTTGYRVLEPPKDLPASDTPKEDHSIIEVQGADGKHKVDYYPNRPVGQKYVDLGLAGPADKTVTPLSGYVNVTGADGRVIAMVDPNDPSKKIDIPAGVKPERPQVVEGSDGAKYAFDGQNLTKLLPGKPDKPQAIQGQDGAIYSYDGTNLRTLREPTPKPPTTIATNTTEPTIVRQNADGTISTVPNPNYKAPTPTALSANTTDPTIVSRNPDGSLRTEPNPNYKPPVPTTVATSAADATIVRQNPDGTLSTVPNPNYKPTDVGSQITQLQQKAQAFHDDLTKQVQAGTLDADKAQQQWDDYWKTEVAPQQQAIGAAQDQQRFTNQVTASNAQASRDQYALTAQRDAQTFAQTAGNETVKSVMDTLPYRVGPQMGADFAKGLNTLSSGGGAVNFSPTDFTFDMPDMESIRHTAVANALKDISPYAASQVGAPIPQVPQGLDLNSLLNQSSYGGGFAPTAPAPAAAPTTTIAPDGTITVQHVAPGGANGGVDTSGADMQYAVPAQLPPASNPWSGNVDLSQLD